MDRNALLPILSTPITKEFEDELLHSDLAHCLREKEKLAVMFGRFNSNVDNRFGLLLNCKMFHFQYRIHKFQKILGQKTFIDLYEELFPGLIIRFDKRGVPIQPKRLDHANHGTRINGSDDADTVPTAERIATVYKQELTRRLERERLEIERERIIQQIHERHISSIRSRPLSRPSVTNRSCYNVRIAVLRYQRTQRKCFNSNFDVISLQHFFIVEKPSQYDIDLSTLFDESTDDLGVVKSSVDVAKESLEHLDSASVTPRSVCPDAHLVDIDIATPMDLSPIAVSRQQAFDSESLHHQTLDGVKGGDRGYDLHRVVDGWMYRVPHTVLRWLQPIRLKVAPAISRDGTAKE